MIHSLEAACPNRLGQEAPADAKRQVSQSIVDMAVFAARGGD